MIAFLEFIQRRLEEIAKFIDSILGVSLDIAARVAAIGVKALACVILYKIAYEDLLKTVLG